MDVRVVGPGRQARLDAFSHEVAILKSCRDRNIVLFIGACLDVRLPHLLCWLY